MNMKTHTKLFWGGIALIVIPLAALAAEIMHQLSIMDTPDAGQLKLSWAFIAFYMVAGGIVLLIFARGAKQLYLKNEKKQQSTREGGNADSKL